MVAEMTGDIPEELVTIDEEGNAVENESLEAQLLPPVERKEQKRARWNGLLKTPLISIALFYLKNS